MYLVIFVTPGKPDAKTQETYRKALNALGDFKLICIGPPGLSAMASYEAMKYLKDGKILPQILAKNGIKKAPEVIVLMTFSAGYGFAREWFKYDGCDVVDCYYAIDSIHAPHKLTGLEPFESFAKTKKPFYILHTDVEPYVYASTSDVANHLKGNFPDIVVAHYPGVGRTMKQQHIDAFVKDGPRFLENVVVPKLLSTHGVHEKVTPPWQNPQIPIPQRCIMLCREELESGVAGKPPGSTSHPRIREYFSGAIRLETGKSLGIFSGNWCAVSQGWVEAQVLVPGEQRVIPWTYSGIEIERFAKANNRWKSIKDVVIDKSLLKEGDLCILQRGKPGSWTRHVCRVIEVSDDSFVTIGGNEMDKWQITKRKYEHPVLGFVAY